MVTFNGRMTGNEDPGDLAPSGAKLPGSTRALFSKKNPGAPGKLGKTSSTAESLSKLRGKGALK